MSFGITAGNVIVKEMWGKHTDYLKPKFDLRFGLHVVRLEHLSGFYLSIFLLVRFALSANEKGDKGHFLNGVPVLVAAI